MRNELDSLMVHEKKLGDFGKSVKMNVGTTTAERLFVIFALGVLPTKNATGSEQKKKKAAVILFTSLRCII